MAAPKAQQNTQFQVQLEKEVREIQQKERELENLLRTKQKLATQHNENELVKVELEKLEHDNEVYKLIGPVLIKQDPDEARSTVQKRLEYLSSELKKTDAGIAALEKLLGEASQRAQMLQLAMQQAAKDAAMQQQRMIQAAQAQAQGQQKATLPSQSSKD